ncbi:MAG TPA: acyl-CoA reductase [Polyangiaceae bacterium]|nr:acyl-CoA reductase [Polyangiaceae bacterium]
MTDRAVDANDGGERVGGSAEAATSVDTNGVKRVRALVAAAARVADATSELGRRARRLLVESTGLSAENVAWGLEEALEIAPSDDDIHALSSSVTAARAAHVILPANVFVAAHRAIALGLAASARVFVRPSRREPVFARLLAEAAPGLFETVAALAPTPGDHVWAYGGDRSLDAVRAALPAGTVLHAQGPGYGLAVIHAGAVDDETAAALARDVAAFDQRGCLSPRAAVVLGTSDDARHFASLVADALAAREREVPLGRLDATELAEIRRFRDAAAYAGAFSSAGSGGVLVTDAVKLGAAPVGRFLTISAVTTLDGVLREVRRELVTAVGVAGTDDLGREVSMTFAEARVSRIGEMQRPRFDGAVDRRAARGPTLSSLVGLDPR